MSKHKVENLELLLKAIFSENTYSGSEDKNFVKMAENGSSRFCQNHKGHFHHLEF